MYMGKKTLRGVGEVVEYTREEIREYIRCKEDIIYFAEKYFYIVSIDDGKHKINLYDFQKKILKLFVGDEDNIILASRQIGKSTISSAFILHYLIFNKNKTIAIMANKESAAKEVLRRVKGGYESLPLWMQQGIVEWNKTTIELESGMRLIASTTSPDSISGETVSLLYMDEFAKVKPHVADDFISATLPVVSSGEQSKVIIVSCVTDDTFVLTNNGIKEVSDFVNYYKSSHPLLGYDIPQYNVYGFNGINTGTTMVNSGHVDTKIIKTTSSSVECSLKHPWFVCDNGVYKWKITKDLNGSEYMCLNYGQDIWGSNNKIDTICLDDYRLDEITNDFAYFIGVYISEGSVCKRIKKNGENYYIGITITCGDDITSILDRLGFKYECPDGMHYRINSKILCDILMSLGFDLSKKAKEKTIPKRLFEMSRDNIISMIQGIMDGDGSSQKNKGTISIRLSSKRLIDQIRILLNNFGILSMWSEGITSKTERVNVESNYYCLELNKTMSKKYFNTVGFRFNRKQLNEKYLPKTTTRDRHDIIPFSKKMIFSLKEKYPDDYTKIRNHGLLKGNYKHGYHCNRPFMLRHKSFLLSLNNPVLNELYEYIDENIKWEPISKIIDSKNKVYDFSLDHNNDDKWCHSVIFNNILGSNTPKGMNHFYSFWKKAQNRESPDWNGYVPIKVNWWDHPKRDNEWKKRTLRRMDNNLGKFLQEYGNRFLGSVATLLDPDEIERCEIREPVELKWNGLMRIYEVPIEKATYVMGVDTAKGTGGDYSVIQVLKIISEEKIKQVAVYRSDSISPHDFAQVCIGISQYYNTAFMMIENNGIGDSLCSTIWYEYEYDYIINLDPKGLGVRSTNKSKLKANLLLKRYFDNKMLEICDYDTIQEFSRYVEVTPNVYKAESDSNDDCVTSLLWALYFITTDYFDGKDITTKEIDDEYKLDQDSDDGPIMFLPDY